MRAATDFRYDGVIGTDFGRAYNAPAEYAALAQNAFDRNRLTTGQFTTRMMNRQPRRDAGAGRRAVYLRVGKDAYVPAMMRGVFRRPRQDGAIEEAEIGFMWVNN